MRVSIDVGDFVTRTVPRAIVRHLTAIHATRCLSRNASKWSLVTIILRGVHLRKYANLRSSTQTNLAVLAYRARPPCAE